MGECGSDDVTSCVGGPLLASLTRTRRSQLRRSRAGRGTIQALRDRAGRMQPAPVA